MLLELGLGGLGNRTALDPGKPKTQHHTAGISAMSASLDVLLMSPQEAKRAGAEPKASVEVALVKAVLEGVRDGFTQLYDLYAPLVHGIVLARVPRAEVDDLVQDIFLHAFKKLHTLRDGSAFGPWIAMIARNRAVDFHRRSRETIEINDELRGRGTQEFGAAGDLGLIRSLPDAYPATLRLRLVERM